ncbi:MAG: hypothetical protein ABIB93_00580 [Chloroflexota bacterium]
MKYLKGLALSLLSLLLFFSLSLYGLTFMLNRTLMEPGFVSAELDKLDIAQFFREIVSSEVPPGQQSSIDTAAVNEALFTAISQSEPQLKEEAKTAIYSGYDYLLGKNDELNITVSLEPVKMNLKSSLRQEFDKSIPQQLVGFPQATVDEYFNQFYEGFSSQIPSTWEIKQSQLSPDTLGLLQTIRQYLSYYRILPNMLIGLILICVLGMIMVERNIKGTFRSLGINLLFYGGIGFVIDFVLNRFGGMSYLPMPGLPPSMASWLTGLMENIMAPVQIFSIVVLAIGAVLLSSSFFIRRPAAEA